MIFNSAIFALFFPIVFVVHWVLPSASMRKNWLLAASYVFYGWWDWRLLSLLIGVSLVCYFTARKLQSEQNKTVLTIAIISVLSVLGVFKYYGFFVAELLPVLRPFGLDESKLLVEIILPVGISFYTFQAISYMVDVYRRDVQAENSFTNVALFIAFFPQLVAGPIIRSKTLLPQIKRKTRLNARMWHLGFRLFLLGFIYKVAIADNLAGYVDPVFGDIAQYDQWAVIWAVIAFHSQIYFDFAGYSTMAIGLAMMLGYRIPRNFRYPYLASSITEFWRRWHISLSSWFRDYLYIPIGGNRTGPWKWGRNIMLTMGLAGLWHGAAWPFVIWGGLHGCALILHKVWSSFFKAQGQAKVIFGFIVTQLLVLGLWSAFRAETFNDLTLLFKVVCGFNEGGAKSLPSFAWLFILPVIADHFFGGMRRRFLKWRPPIAIYWGCVGFLIGWILYIYPSQTPPFIYFQF